jgi:hypothetical protein
VVAARAAALVDRLAVDLLACTPVVAAPVVASVDTSSVAWSECTLVDGLQLESEVDTPAALGLVDMSVVCRPAAGQLVVEVGIRSAVVDEVVELPSVVDLRHDGRELPNLVARALAASNSRECTHTGHRNNRSMVAHKGSCLDVLHNGRQARPIRNCSNASSRRAKLHYSHCMNTLAPITALVACEKHNMALVHQAKR